MTYCQQALHKAFSYYIIGLQHHKEKDLFDISCLQWVFLAWSNRRVHEGKRHCPSCGFCVEFILAARCISLWWHCADISSFLFYHHPSLSLSPSCSPREERVMSPNMSSQGCLECMMGQESVPPHSHFGSLRMVLHPEMPLGPIYWWVMGNKRQCPALECVKHLTGSWEAIPHCLVILVPSTPQASKGGSSFGKAIRM